MQAPSGLSFLSHIAINIYFFLKGKFSARIGSRAATPGPLASAAAGTCTAIILAIALFNIYAFWTTAYYGATNSPNLELASAAVAVEAAEEKTNVSEKPPVCSAVAASLSAVRPNVGGNEKTAPATLAVTIEKGQTLWEATRRLLLESIGGDPCANNEDPVLCQAAIPRSGSETQAAT
ncbi:MAG: hypothetical protein MUD10_03215, partial [Candidatus Pacebacteria bacterium]|nr:hypothetical protein [Candidatus Paceibacterota bacterium]